MMKAVIFDFGGVLAEEGFREGLMTIGKQNGLDPDSFYTISGKLAYQMGYVTCYRKAIGNVVKLLNSDLGTVPGKHSSNNRLQDIY